MTHAHVALTLWLCWTGALAGCHSVERDYHRWTGFGSRAADAARVERSSTDASSAEADAAVASGVRDASSVAVTQRGCARVAHIGDSLTYHAALSLYAAYQRVGARAQISAYGGRAVLQKLPVDSATGQEAAVSFRSKGFDGCWVVALGTNDTANVASGVEYTRAQAIDEMMRAIDPSGRAPVMWVNTYTTRRTGDWSNDNMVLWNEALDRAKSRWANLHVFDWAAIAKGGTAPLADGIHHTAAGYEVRNAAIARALVGITAPEYPPDAPMTGP